jgi:proteasome lid subunit RPN8/RPN11
MSHETSWNSHEERQIILGPLEELIQTIPGRPPMWPTDAALPSSSPEVLFCRSAWQSITQHATSESQHEVGGMLFGEVYADAECYFVVATVALPARWTDAGPAHLKFTGQSWLDILYTQREEYPETCMVGWYHSHPGWGIFLSGSDLFIHRNFFNHRPWYIAVVVDPHSETYGCFRWQGDLIQRNDDVIWVE